MTSYPYISALFTAILSKSKSIEGRFYVCPKGGYEINSDVLGQVLEQVNVSKKYPLVLMMPARSNEDEKMEWSTYYITLFFLKTTYYGTGNVINPNTNTSISTIQGDWALMRKSAREFVSTLNALSRRTFYKNFRINRSTIITKPETEVGADRASGVRLDFQLLLWEGCEPLEDYEESEISSIQIPQ